MRRTLLPLICLAGLALAGCGQTNTQAPASPPAGGREAMDKSKRAPEGEEGKPRSAPVDDGKSKEEKK